MAKSVSMQDLKKAVENYPVPGSRRVMIEYVLLPDINDHTEELAALAEWTRGLKCLVNFVPFNTFQGSKFRSPTADECRRALTYLRNRDIPATVRWPRGRSVDAACGQLALKHHPTASAPLIQLRGPSSALGR